MEVVELADPAEFLERAGPLLLADEPRHNLILGIAGTLRDSPHLYGEHRLWLVDDGGEVVGAALRTPPHNLVLARPRVAQAQQALASAIGGALPGVTAALPEADGFADAWEAKTGARRGVRVAQKIYALERLRPVEDVPGTARPATDADRPLLRLWLRHFGIEALGETEQDEERTERLLDHRLGSASAGFVIWQDGLPVSLAGFGGETPHGVRIGPVYTPPVLRGRGYGSAVTAAVTAERLGAGRRFCFLYTDATNPTSNKIYTDIGYEPVCEAVDYAFY
ncbi:MAG: GNAT family N-acetyltransferase [Actinobacteria bacterium]|nr:GNAT family N-acetyltransferase [Actinomycetota bacterium]